MGARIGDIAVLLLGATALYIMVRPRSKGAELVQALGQLLSALVTRATDLGSDHG